MPICQSSTPRSDVAPKMAADFGFTFRPVARFELSTVGLSTVDATDALDQVEEIAAAVRGT